MVLFAVPGAFTPLCSAQHLPGYVERAKDIQSKGVDTIVCLAVNDAFVMGAWAEAQGVGDKVLMAADGSADFARACLVAGVRHRRTRPYRPRTNGKVERSNRTLLEEWAYVRVYRSEHARTEALQWWLHRYDHHRGYTALGGLPPVSRVTNLPGQYT